MNGDALKKEFVEKYNSVGEQKFYRFLLSYAINKLIKIRDGEYKANINNSPEIEFLNYSDKFLCLYRQDDKEIYLILSKTFRKAGNKIYRLMLKKSMTQKNNKFFNLA